MKKFFREWSERQAIDSVALLAAFGCLGVAAPLLLIAGWHLGAQ